MAKSDKVYGLNKPRSRQKGAIPTTRPMPIFTWKRLRYSLIPRIQLLLSYLLVSHYNMLNPTYLSTLQEVLLLTPVTQQSHYPPTHSLTSSPVLARSSSQVQGGTKHQGRQSSMQEQQHTPSRHPAHKS